MSKTGQAASGPAFLTENSGIEARWLTRLTCVRGPAKTGRSAPHEHASWLAGAFQGSGFTTVNPTRLVTLPAPVRPAPILQ